MNGKERVRALLNDESADRTGFWIGNPTHEAKLIYCEALGVERPVYPEGEAKSADDDVLLTKRSVAADIELAHRFGSDLFWWSPEHDPLAWRHPEGKPMFDVMGGIERKSLGQPGKLGECEDPAEIDDYVWPNPDYLDFTSTIETIDLANEKGMAVFGGMWMPFFHMNAFFLGMENYFMKMYTHPEVIDALTEKVLEFYLEANERCLQATAGKIEAVFFGNDLGSQEDLMLSPDMLERFVMPGVRRIVEQAHRHGVKVVLHSCGAIGKLIPALIDAGIDGLHPLQAKAKGMEAETLAAEFKDKVTFIGGVDTQQLLPFGTPEEIKTDVARLRDVLGERLIVSPSHEALLHNVSTENALAMRDAAIA